MSVISGVSSSAMLYAQQSLPAKATQTPAPTQPTVQAAAPTAGADTDGDHDGSSKGTQINTYA